MQDHATEPQRDRAMGLKQCPAMEQGGDRATAPKNCVVTEPREDRAMELKNRPAMEQRGDHATAPKNCVVMEPREDHVTGLKKGHVASMQESRVTK